MTLVASIRKHNGDMNRLREWFNALPMKYPEYRILGVKVGQYVFYTKEYGLDVID